MAELQEQLKVMEEEVVTLRRRLQDAPKRVRTLEERLLDTKGQLAQAISQNEKLTYTLREAREHIAALREEVDKLTQPPSAYGTLLGINEDGSADVYSSGRKMRVEIHPAIDAEVLVRGAEVVLNESLNIVKVRSPERSGEVVIVKEMLEGGERAFIVGRADEERVVELAEHLIGTAIRRHLAGLVKLDAVRVTTDDTTLYIDILYTRIETAEEEAEKRVGDRERLG